MLETIVIDQQGGIMIVDYIEKNYSMNVVGPQQFQTQRFSTTIGASVPESAKAQTDEGKKEFLEFSDKVFKIAKALTERDALPAIKLAQEQGGSY